MKIYPIDNSHSVEIVERFLLQKNIKGSVNGWDTDKWLQTVYVPICPVVICLYPEWVSTDVGQT